MSNRPHDSVDKGEPSGESQTRRTAILNKQNPISIIEMLPPAVFPVSCRFSISRGRSHDQIDAKYRQPTYPVDLHQPEGAYVPDTTVHFDNPARRAPNGEVAWSPDDFGNQMEALVETSDTLSDEDISLSRLTLVEVPQHLVTTDSDTGSHVVKSNLYTDENEMVIARFQKHNSLSAAHVRNKISEALPGESRTPARLTDLIEVTAKPARHGAHTTTTAGRDRYYTEAEADLSGSLDRTPAHYQSRFLDTQSERTRPLGPAISKLGEFVPELRENTEDLVQIVKFIGHEEERRSFVATEVRR